MTRSPPIDPRALSPRGIEESSVAVASDYAAADLLISVLDHAGYRVKRKRTRDMLPYPVHAPAWTRYGYSSLTTRPQLALHRSQYGSVPRLYPARGASLLCAPESVADFDDLTAARRKSQRFLRDVPRVERDGVLRHCYKVVPVLEPDKARRTTRDALASPGQETLRESPAERWEGLKVMRAEERRVKKFKTDMGENVHPEVVHEFSLSVASARQGVVEDNIMLHQREVWQRGPAESGSAPACVPAGVLQSLCSEALEQEAELSKDAIHAKRRPVHGGKSYKGKSVVKRALGNPLCTLNIGEDCLLACSNTGYLDSLDICSLNLKPDKDGGVDAGAYNLTRLGMPSRMTDSLVYDRWPVVDLNACGTERSSSDPARLVATQAQALYIAGICMDRQNPVLEWCTKIDMPGTCFGTAVNGLCPSEVVALDGEGMHVFDVHRNPTSAVDADHIDIQPIDSRLVYDRVFYGAHPRTLYISNSNGVKVVDLRLDEAAQCLGQVLDVKTDWKLPAYDWGLSFFQPLPQNNDYISAVATQTCVAYFDMRMPRMPLLEWTLKSPQPVGVGCAASLQSPEKPQLDVIALGYPRTGQLDVLHSIRTPSSKRDMCGPFGSEKERRPVGVSRSPMLWCDLPLSHLDTLPPSTHTHGMAFVMHAQESRISLVQWSQRYGLMAQLLAYEQYNDGDVIFERGAVAEQAGNGNDEGKDADGNGGRRSGVDNSFGFNWDTFTQLANVRDVRASENLGGDHMANDNELFRRAVEESEPGSYLIRSTRRLFMRDAVELRNRVVRDNDDEVGEAGQIQIPRPDLGDLPLVLKQRANESRERAGERKRMGRRAESSLGSLGEGSDVDDDVCILDWRKPYTRPRYDGVLGMRRRLRGAWGDKPKARFWKRVDGIARASDSLNTGQATGGWRSERGQYSSSASSESSSDVSVDLEAVGMLVDDLSTGKTVDEMARVLRAGFSHCATPLDVEMLAKTVECSPFVQSERVQWPGMDFSAKYDSDSDGDCNNQGEVHDVQTEVPAWVPNRVYISGLRDEEENEQTPAIPENSGFGRMIARMRASFDRGTERALEPEESDINNRLL